MQFQDRLPAHHVWLIHCDVSIESTRPEQCGIKDVRAVGRADNHDPATDLEAVHLDEDLVQGLLAFILSPGTASRATFATSRIQLVDEDDRRRDCANSLE